MAWPISKKQALANPEASGNRDPIALAGVTVRPVTGKPSRNLWIAAIVVSVVCVGGLAYALVAEWNTEPARELAVERRVQPDNSSGFGLGLLIGVGAGVVLGSLLVLRRK